MTSNVPRLSLFDFKRIRGCCINFALYKCFYSILYPVANKNCLFFLRRWPQVWQPENSIKSHMVSYCSVIKCSFYKKMEVGGENVTTLPLWLPQQSYRKYFKCKSFHVTTDLLNSENLRIAITQLCHEQHI